MIAPRLDASIIAPAPKVSRQHRRRAPSLNTNVIAPAPTQVSAAESRSTPALSAHVIAPAPLTSGIEVPSTRVRVTNVAVVPPPVSAPERNQMRKAKLNLPAPSVVAPPPSADSAHDLRWLESGVASSPTVVPPPPAQPSAPSFMSSIIGKIFGTQDVVPPPPSVSSEAHTSSRELAANIVPPPPSITSSNRSSGRTLAPEIVPPAPSASGASGFSRTSPRAPSAAIVPPPPSVSASGNTSATARSTSNRNLLKPEIVPPPPSVQANAAGSATKLDSIANRLANNIVPPPPSVASESASGSARNAFGAPTEIDSSLAPPKSTAGNNGSSGVVASAQPGSDLGVPNATRSALAISPSGKDKAGLGGSGAGTGIGNAKGTGSGLTGEKPSENSGAGKTGSGRGFEQTARGGISTTPGRGGAGGLATGSPAVPGVDVHGGTTVITLPSFAADGGDPNPPPRSNVKSAQGPAITIVATSRSGGVFNFYGELPGNNYSVYIDTKLGTVVMQFADANPATNSQLETLTGPEAIRTDLPANLPHARMVVKCRLTTSGNIANLKVLEPGPAVMTAKIVAALPGWKFRPAMRGTQPVEVNAILGFNINTSDRY